MLGNKGGEANQDVRGRMDCQEEMLGRHLYWNL